MHEVLFYIQCPFNLTTNGHNSKVSGVTTFFDQIEKLEVLTAKSKSFIAIEHSISPTSQGSN
jgi:hypothetical protein